MKKLLLVAAAAFLLSACGIKSDLVTPDGKATPQDQQDPSKPPHPLGQ